MPAPTAPERRRDGQRRALHLLRDRLLQLARLDDPWVLVDALHDSLDRSETTADICAVHLLAADGSGRSYCRGGGERGAAAVAAGDDGPAQRAWRGGQPSGPRTEAEGETPALRDARSRIDATFGLGVLTVASLRRHAFDAVDKEFLHDLAALVDLGTRLLPCPLLDGDVPEATGPVDLEQLPLGVARTDLHGEIHYANDALRRLLGPERKGHLRQLWVHPAQGRRLLERVRAEGQGRAELEMQDPKGASIWVRVSLRRCTGPGRVEGLEAVFEDVSDERRALAGRDILRRARAASLELESRQDLTGLLARLAADLSTLGGGPVRCRLCLREPGRGGWRLYADDGTTRPPSTALLEAIEAIHARGGPVYAPDRPQGEADDGIGAGPGDLRCWLDLHLTVGLLTVASRRPHAFDQRHRELLEDVALAIDAGLQRLLRLEARTTLDGSRRGTPSTSGTGASPKDRRDAWLAVLESVPVGVIHNTPDGRFIYQNRRFEQMLGYSDEDRRHGNCVDIYVDPADRERLTAALETHGEHAYEYRVYHRDGRRVWLRGRSHRFQDPAGDTIYQGVAHDVTRERQLEGRELLRLRAAGAMQQLASVAELSGVVELVRRGLADLDMDCGLCVRIDDPRHGEPATRICADATATASQDPVPAGTDSVLNMESSPVVLEVTNRGPHPLSEGDVVLLHDLARAIGDGVRHLIEQQELVERNESLEQEVARRRTAETALRASEERYRRIMKGLPVGVLHATANGRLLYWNPAFEHLLGYDAAELARLRIADLHVDSADNKALVEALVAHGAHDWEAAFRRGDGRVVWLRGVFRRLDGDGQGAGEMQGILEDVTAQRLQQRRETALHQLRDEVWRMRSEDDIDRVIAATHTCLLQLDVPVEGCTVQRVDEADPLHPVVTFIRPAAGGDWRREAHAADSAFTRRILDRWRRGEVLYRRDLTSEDPEGDYEVIIERHGVLVRAVIDVPFSAGLLAINSQRPAAFSEHDIASLRLVAEALDEGFHRLDDLRRLERRNLALEEQIAQRESLEDQLRQAQRMEAVGHLTAGLAHNFNNILQAILANLEMAAAGRGELSGLIDEAHGATRKAADLVRQLLSYSGRSARARTEVLPLRDILDQAFALFEPAQIGHSLQVDYEPPPAELYVRCGSGQLEQVFLNLLVNARDAVAEAEAPRIRLEVAHGDHHPDAVEIRVIDNGVGMTETTMARIFDPFYTTKQVGAGTGLGLFTAYGILQKQGGRIECDSQPERGTTFTVTLPVAPTAPQPSSQVEAMPEGDGERVLVIDDQDAVRSSLCRLLRQLGYQTLEASGGMEGLELYRQSSATIDVVLLDLAMPGMSGHRVYEQLKAWEPQVAVLIMTGLEEDAPEGVRLVLKPFEVPDLLGALRQTIAGSK